MPALSQNYTINSSYLQELSNFFQILHLFIKKEQPSKFSLYEVDMKLYRMKIIYESLFPWTTRGGSQKLTDKFVENVIPEKVKKPLAEFIYILYPEQSPITITRTLKSIKTLGVLIKTYPIPPFIVIVAHKSGYSKTAISSRFRIGKSIQQGQLRETYIDKYRSGEWSRTRMLAILSHLSRVKGKPVIKKVDKHHCGDCAVADFTALCPYCGQLIIVCHHQLKHEQENACQDFRK